MDALSVAGWWLTIRNFLNPLGRPCIRVVPETCRCKHSLVVAVELVDLPYYDPVCIALGLRWPPCVFLTSIHLQPFLATPDRFPERLLLVLLHPHWLDPFVLGLSSPLLPRPILTHRPVLLYGPSCHPLALLHLLWPFIRLIRILVESTTIFQLALTLSQMFLCLFKLLESLPLEELVRRTDTLEATHLQVLEEVEMSVASCCCRMWLSIDIRVVNGAITWLL